MASNTEQRKIQIIADGSQVNATMNQMAAAVKVLHNELKKLPKDSQEFADKSAQFQTIRANMKDVKDEMFGTETALQKATKSLGGFAAGLGIAFGVNTIVNFFKGSSDSAKEFEKSLSSLSALTGAVGEELEFYRKEAELIGQTTTLSASQAAEAFQIMGGAVPALMAQKETLAAVTKEVVFLAEASGESLPASAQAMASAMNMFGLEASEAGRIINALAAGSTAGAAEVPDLTAAIDKAGLTARNFNVSIEESVALTELLAEGNLKGAEAGTALRNVLLKMQTIEALPKNALVQLEKFGVDLTVVSDKSIPLQDRLMELSKISGDATAMMRVFGVENVNAGTQILQNIPAYESLVDAVTDTNTAYEQAAIRTDNLDGDLKGLASAFESLQIGVGTFINQAMRPVIQAFTTLILGVKELPKFLDDNRELFAALGIAVLTFNAANIKATASTLAHTAAEKGRAIATQATAVAQRVLNAAMTANPIGIIITMVGALVAVLVNLYRTNENVRAGINALWAGVKAAFTGIKESALDILGGVGNLIWGIFTFDADKIKEGMSGLTAAAKEVGNSAVDAYRESYTTSLQSANEEITATHQEGADAVVEVEEEKVETITELEEESAKERKARLKQEADERKKLQEDFAKKEIEAQKAYEDLQLALMDEGIEKKIAKLTLEHQRAMAELDIQREEILANTAITEEQKAALLENYRMQEELKDQEYKEKKAELEAEERELALEKIITDLQEEEEIKSLELQEAFFRGLQTEREMEEARLNLQKEYLQKRLEALEAAGLGETLQAQKLKTAILGIDKQIADGKIAEAQRAEDFKHMLQEQGFEAAKGFMQLGLDLMKEESKGRKVLATAMKATEIAQVTMQGIKEIQSIWAGAATLGPIAGPITGAIQTGVAVARTGLAINKIRTTQYAKGGATVSGDMVDMILDRSGTWRMPDGVGASWVGSYAKGGPVGSASFGVIGEKGAEWVGPNWMLRSPRYANIFGYLEAERRKATPFAVGGATAPAPQLPAPSGSAGGTQDMGQMVEQFDELRTVMMDIRDLLEQWPSVLRVVNDPRDIVNGINVLNEIETDSRINR